MSEFNCSDLTKPKTKKGKNTTGLAPVLPLVFI